MLVSTLLPLLLLACPALGDVVHVPLQRLAKRAPIQQTLGGVTSEVGNGLSFPIKLGTPPQDLSVFIGMGSASGLTMFGCNGCNNEPFYKPKLSSTWNKTISAGGPFEVAYDTLGVLGKTVEKAPCAYANSTYATKQYSSQSGQGGQFSLGLGLRVNKDIGAVVPALSTMWDEPVFGVHIGQGSKGGQISFGGVDSTLYSGNVKFVPTVNNLTWNFAADGLKVDNAAIDMDEYLASAAAAMSQKALENGAAQGPDSQRKLVIRPEIGYDQLQVTPAIADKLFAPIAGSVKTEAVASEANEEQIIASTGMPSTSGYSYTVPCNTNVTLSFTLNGTDYHIPAGKWVIKDGTTTNCKTKVQVSNQESFGDDLYDMLVGTLFLDSIYSAYKYDAVQPQIGFAQLSDKANSAASGAASSAASSSAASKPTGATSGTSHNAVALPGAALAAAALAVVVVVVIVV